MTGRSPGPDALTASGNMPTEAWKMDVEICVAGRASYVFEP